MTKGLAAISSSGVLLLALAATSSGPVQADMLEFPLTSCHISAGGCPASAGEVTVSSVGTSNTKVLVTLTLDPGEVFAVAGGQGAGRPLLFDVSGTPALTVSNLTAPFSYSQAKMSTMFDGTGTWNYIIDCTTANVCGTGTSKQLTGPISFDVSLAGGGTLTPGSFVANSKGFYFSADIGILNGSGTYNTGDVAANTVTAVPLPPSAALLGSALVLCLALMRRSAPGQAVPAFTS
jgi:hypothetical protein